MALPEALLWHAKAKDSLSEYMELVEAEGSVFIEIGPSKPALASHGVSSSGLLPETARMLKQRSVRCSQRLRAALDAQAQRIAATDAASGAQPCGFRIISIIHPKQLPRGRQRGAGSHPRRGDCTMLNQRLNAALEAWEQQMAAVEALLSRDRQADHGEASVNSAASASAAEAMVVSCLREAPAIVQMRCF